jgi:uncharacterized membrane protein required for colicin V production
MVADVVFLAIVLYNLILGTMRGFMRSTLRMVTSIVSLIAAFFLAKPVAEFINNTWDVADKLEPWINEHIGFLERFNEKGWFALFILTVIGLFIVIRLLLIIVDRLLKKLKESSQAVNFLDKTLGFLFGIVMAAVAVVGLLMTIDALASIKGLENLPAWLQLTEDTGFVAAWRVYDFSKDHIFDIVEQIFEKVTSHALELL